MLDHRLMRTAVLFCFAQLLGGCAVIEASNAYNAELKRKLDDARLMAARTSCEKYGVVSNSEPFATCVQTEVNKQLDREALVSAARAAEPAIPSSKTTSCVKTLMGVQCTTQ